MFATFRIKLKGHNIFITLNISHIHYKEIGIMQHPKQDDITTTNYRTKFIRALSGRA